MKEPTMCRLTLHNSQVYKRDCKCHRLTKKGIFANIYITQNEKNKWHPKVKIVYDYSTKRYAKIVEVQIVQQQRSTLEQLECASSSVTFSRSKMSLPPSSITRSLHKLNHCPPKYFSQLALSAVVRQHLYFLCVWSSMRVIVLCFSFRIVLATSFRKC